MIAGRFIQVAATDHAKSLAVLLAEVFSRQLEKKISHCNFIQFNALTLGNDILIVITAYGRNNNMVEVIVKRSFQLFKTPVAGDSKSKIHGIHKVDNASPVIDPAVNSNGRSESITTDIGKLVRTYLISEVTGFSDDTEKLF
jgi:hypothetical protein